MGAADGAYKGFAIGSNRLDNDVACWFLIEAFSGLKTLGSAMSFISYQQAASDTILF